MISNGTAVLGLGNLGAQAAKPVMEYYTFCHLSGLANVLVMPGLHSAHISTNLVHELVGGTVIGPLLKVLSKPAQIVPWSANVWDMVNISDLAAYDSLD